MSSLLIVYNYLHIWIVKKYMCIANYHWEFSRKNTVWYQNKSNLRNASKKPWSPTLLQYTVVLRNFILKYICCTVRFNWRDSCTSRHLFNVHILLTVCNSVLLFFIFVPIRLPLSLFLSLSLLHTTPTHTPIPIYCLCFTFFSGWCTHTCTPCTVC